MAENAAIESLKSSIDQAARKRDELIKERDKFQADADRLNKSVRLWNNRIAEYQRAIAVLEQGDLSKSPLGGLSVEVAADNLREY